ncbi:ACP phosphodiesterase [Reichenbachiella sp. MALMAid0571]|uniref:acyl carrier protein phosphodiesterase n=1 Tax=Reichenbachiella sp. MALMAid0571 TaxID=3143939 RepID=UPI0032DEE846
MNFLAHLYLSKDSEKIAIGNFIADFVKGNQIEAYDQEIKKGILMHREIDRFTDSHGIVKESKARLWEKYRHYGAVIVDIYYDHFLSKNWNWYSEEPLKEFTKRQYAMLSMHSADFPIGAGKTLKYMKQTDWLYNYQFLDGIDMALKGMSRRAKFDSGMESAIRDLNKDYELYQAEFASFFPLLEKHITDFEINELK